MSAPYYTSPDGSIQIFHADCRDVLPTLEAGSVDLVLTDPPYGIGYVSSRTTRLGDAPRVHEATFGDDVFDPSWLSDALRVLRDDASLYLFTRWDVLHRWHAAIEQAGAHVTQRLVWDKAHFKMGDLRYYGSQTEDVLYCRKGTPVMHWKHRHGNLYRYSSAFLPEGQLDHPTQKPEQLLRLFIVHSTTAGATVLDPFSGSGTTLRAAMDLGRKAVGIEIEERYCEIAAKRLQQAVLPLEAA